MNYRYLAGVVLAVVGAVAVGCGGSSEPSAGGAPTATTGADALSAADWRTQADAICTQYKAKLDALTQPTAENQVVPFLKEGLAITTERAMKLEELAAPDEVKEAQATITRLQKDTNDKITAAMKKIESGTEAEAAFNEFNGAIEKNGTELDAAAKAAGLTSCGGD